MGLVARDNMATILRAALVDSVSALHPNYQGTYRQVAKNARKAGRVADTCRAIGLNDAVPDMCSVRRVQCPTCAVPDVRCPRCTMPEMNNARKMRRPIGADR
jgi:hypothetical protein